MPYPIYVPEAYDWAPGMRIADIIARGGEQRAALLQRQGETSAVGWHNIGNILGGALTELPRAQREEAQTKLYNVEAQTKAQTAKRLSDRETKLFSLFSDPANPPKPEQVMAVDPVQGPHIVAGLESLDKMKEAQGQEALTHLPAVTRGFLAATDTPAGRGMLWRTTLRPAALKTGLWKPADLPEEYHSGVEDNVVKFAQGYQPPEKKVVVGPDHALVGETTGTVAYTAPPAPHPAQHVEALLDGKPAMVSYHPLTSTYTDATGADVTRRVTPKPAAATIIQGEVKNDAKDIANAIIEGKRSPDLRGLYRLAGPISAELARQGYDHRTAVLDWEATKRHIATLNGPQQTRFSQAITTALDSLDVIRSLADRWDAGQWKALNKTQLGLAKQGVLGKEAASLATQLEAQIADVTSELGQVYMGGNSPTDHALKLAGTNLSADWSKKTLLDALDLAEKNLTIRRNSQIHAGPLGLSTPEAPRSGVEGADRGAGQAATPAEPVQTWSRDASGQLAPTPRVNTWQRGPGGRLVSPSPSPSPSPSAPVTPTTPQVEEWERVNGRLVRKVR